MAHRLPSRSSVTRPRSNFWRCRGYCELLHFLFSTSLLLFLLPLICRYNFALSLALFLEHVCTRAPGPIKEQKFVFFHLHSVLPLLL